MSHEPTRLVALWIELMQAKEYIFDERRPAQPIDFGAAAAHRPDDERIVPGAVVTLRLNAVPIDVEVLDQEHPDTWVGQIRGFEGHAGRQFKGLAVGDVVRLHPQHVFACQYDVDHPPSIRP